MELAIVAVALGGMYVISNQKKTNTLRETFTNDNLDVNVDTDAKNLNDKYFIPKEITKNDTIKNDIKNDIKNQV